MMLRLKQIMIWTDIQKVIFFLQSAGHDDLNIGISEQSLLDLHGIVQSLSAVLSVMHAFLKSQNLTIVYFRLFCYPNCYYFLN